MDIHLLLDTENKVTVRTTAPDLVKLLISKGCISLGIIHGYNAGFNSTRDSQYKSITGKKWKSLYLKENDENIQN